MNRIKHSLIWAIISTLTAITTACGGGKQFKITVELPNDVDRMVVMTYNTPSGVKQAVAHMDGGKATLVGECREFTAAALAWSDGEPLAKCIVKNGDHVTLAFTSGGVMPRVSGSKPTANYLAFINDNSQAIAQADVDALNIEVAKYVAANPGDPAALQLVADYFYLPGNESKADSLVAALAPEARTTSLLMNYGVVNSANLADSKTERIYQFGGYSATDSFLVFRPHDARQTLFAFLSTARPSRRRQVDRLKGVDKAVGKLRGRIVELSLQPDSAMWRMSIRGDSATWTQAWMPGNVAATAYKRFAVPREPFYVVVDSAGNQLYRGGDVSAALQIMETNHP